MQFLRFKSAFFEIGTAARLLAVPLTLLIGTLHPANNACASDTNFISKLPETGAWTLTNDDILAVTHFADVLVGGHDQVSSYVWDRLPRATQVTLQDYLNTRPRTAQGQAFDPPLLDALLPELDKILQGELIYTAERFSRTKLGVDTEQFLALKPRGDALVHLNRMLLEDAYPGVVAKSVRIVTNVGPSRFAVVDTKKKYITFYRDDGQKISSVDILGEMKMVTQAWMTPGSQPDPIVLMAMQVDPEDQLVLKFTDPDLTVFFGRKFGVIDVAPGRFIYQGSN
jgi:hypothetical protein